MSDGTYTVGGVINFGGLGSSDWGDSDKTNIQKTTRNAI
jgi:hypothetical protein